MINRKCLMIVLFLTGLITLPASLLAATDIGIEGHWLQFRGEKILLVGDSVTQGWMECGPNFDSHAYVDALASRKINMLMLWSYMATSSSRQIEDSRIGYDSPEYWPWTKKSKTFDLNSFNTAYFDALKDLVSYANSKNIVVLITIHDGWTKTLFDCHQFNSANGGPLAKNSQYVDLADYSKEMPAAYNADWTWQQKNQYFQERFVNHLIDTVGNFPNVMFEIFNEGEWYNTANLRAHQVHFLNYIKARTSCPTMVNDDGVGGADFFGEANCDIISLHYPQWNSSSNPSVFFNAFVKAYSGSPAKPQFFSEPVKSVSPGEWRGEPELVDPLMRMMWGTALAAAGFVVQNDTSFGFDPKAKIADQSSNRDKVLDVEGYCCEFFNESGLNLDQMAPNSALASTGVCLADPGKEYVVYSQSGLNFTVDLSAASGKTLDCRFYNPRTGTFESTFKVNGSNSAESFTKPTDSDWVLHVVSIR